MTRFTNKEKRVFPRLGCRLPLTLVLDSAEIHEADSCDLSLSGVGLEASAEMNLQVGDDLSVLVMGYRAVSASVCWRDNGRVGLEFRGNISEIASSWVGDCLASRGVVFRQILPRTVLNRRAG